MSAAPPNTARGPARLEVLIAVGLALVSITAGLIAWRNSTLSAAQSDVTRQGLRDVLKQEEAASAEWRQTYQEAADAQSYDTYAAGVGVLAASTDPAAQTQADQLKQFLLPALAQLSPLATDAAYRNKDGSLNLEQRFKDLQASHPDLAQLAPQAAFNLGDAYASEQRWLSLAVVLLVVTLFWLILAQVSGRRVRAVMLVISGIFYLISLGGFGLVELIAFILRARG